MKILVVAAHPDDEVLGCGGMVLGRNPVDEVHILIMTDGAGDVRGFSTQRTPRDLAGIQKESVSIATAPAWRNAHKAAAMIRADSLIIHDLPDSRFDSVDVLDMAHLVEATIDRVRPNVVYTHHGGDLSVDHRRTHEAVLCACRHKPDNPVKELYFFEVPSNTEWAAASTFIPQKYVPIDPVWKWEVLHGAYQSETREFPHPRSQRAIEHLSGLRGSQVGLEAAEAFMVGRIIG